MNYMELALKLSHKASKKNEIPVGAVLVLNDKIIAKAYNKREKRNEIISHAEINCIIKASKKLKTWKLDNCELYVTLKPCSMCENVIKQSRIKKVYYLLDKNDIKREFYKTKIIKFDNELIEKKYNLLLSNFFKNKRINKKL